MTTQTDHPMDGFPVRPLVFDVKKVDPENLVWSRTSPWFSMFINALGLHVPYFERYLIRALSKAKTHLDDPRLLRDVGAIIGQEAHHAKNFMEFNQALVKRYPKLARYEAEAKAYFGQRAQTDTLKELVGFTAGYETFTFLAGALVLQNHDKWFADADPVVKAMWIWHQVEEVEHGAAAFEVYQSLFGKHTWYRRRMVITALMHIAGETHRAFVHMSWREGWWRNPFYGMASVAFCWIMLARFAWNALPVLRGNYHPHQHPIVTTEQNPIQIAWRRFEKAGGNVLEIDHQKMAEMMGVAAPSA